MTEDEQPFAVEEEVSNIGKYLATALGVYTLSQFSPLVGDNLVPDPFEVQKAMASLREYARTLVGLPEVRERIEAASQSLAAWNASTAPLRLGTPALGTQAATETLEAFKARLDTLLEDIPSTMVSRLDDLVLEVNKGNLTPEAFHSKVSDELGIAERRAESIGTNEVLQANASLDERSALESGATEFTWVTMGDHKVRPYHKLLDGRVFRYDDPPEVNEAGDKMLPGHDYNCRRVARPVLPQQVQLGALMKYSTGIPQPLSAESGPPSKVRLLRTGENVTSKGTFYYDPADKEAILEAQALYDGRDLYPIDVGHLSLKEDSHPDGHKSLGWWKLVLDDEGIWADEIEWTSAGTELLKDRSFRFTSPTFYHDDDGRVTQILNFALTNEPATYNPYPLVADKVTPQGTLMTDQEKKEETLESAAAEEALPPEAIEEIAIDYEAQIAQLQEELAEAARAVAQAQADKAESDARVAELEAIVAKMEAEAIEEEKDELLSEFADEDEKDILKDLPLEQLRKLSQVRLSKKPAGIVAKRAPSASLSKEPARTTTLKSIPTKEEIQRLASARH